MAANDYKIKRENPRITKFNSNADYSINIPGLTDVVYDGTAIVPATHEYRFESPFYFDGITYDEYFVEWCYHSACIACQKMVGYKPLREQLIDGDITFIPDEYKKLCPFPEKCTAFMDLVKVA